MKFVLALLAGVALAAPARASLLGTADLTPNPIGGGLYQDTVVIHNTGTTTIGTFWFSWIRGYDFMPHSPTSIISPAGWTPTVFGGPYPSDGYSILWQANSAASYLAAGSNLSGFGFTTQDSPAVLQGPVTITFPPTPNRLVVTSFFYIGTAQADPGLEFNVNVVPAPTGFALLGLGALSLRRRR